MQINGEVAPECLRTLPCCLTLEEAPLACYRARQCLQHPDPTEDTAPRLPVLPGCRVFLSHEQPSTDPHALQVGLGSPRSIFLCSLPLQLHCVRGFSTAGGICLL